MPDFRQYFHPDYGLRARTAARALLKQGPLAYGLDGRFWGYDEGVWSDVEDTLHRRAVDLLDERFRVHHLTEIRAALRAMVEPMTVEPTQRYVNMPNGMIQWDAEGGPDKLTHHEAYGSTVQLPVTWHPDATCDDFDAFIDASIVADDRQRVWEIIGYLMMSGNPLQRMFLLTGGGGNGKGVLLHVLMALLGRTNVANVPLHSFITDKFAPARLFNKLANVCGDIDTTYIEQTGLIKELAGEDLIDGERKYGQPFQFEFWGKSIFSANGIPSSADGSIGWTRRWEVVNFPNKPMMPDPGLKRRLSTPESLRGIAAKAITALRELMARGTFHHGESAAAVHRTFAQKSNKVLLWLHESTMGDPSSWYPRDELLRRFRGWDAYANPSGRSMGSHKFYELMRAVDGIRETKRRGVFGFGGVRLLEKIAYSEVIDGSPDSDEETAPSEGGISEFVQGSLL